MIGVPRETFLKYVYFILFYHFYYWSSEEDEEKINEKPVHIAKQWSYWAVQLHSSGPFLWEIRNREVGGIPIAYWGTVYWSATSTLINPVQLHWIFFSHTKIKVKVGELWEQISKQSMYNVGARVFIDHSVTSPVMIGKLPPM